MTDQERIARLREGTWDHTVVRGPNPTGFCVDETPFIQETADRIEELEAKMAKAVGALKEIAGRHIPSQPATDGGDEIDWCHRQYASLRGIALTMLAELEGK